MTLQAMVQQEIDDNLTQAKNSATDALMWLCRALWFLSEYMNEFSRSHASIPSECLYMAYQETLKQYHNWVVRGIFALTMRSCPSKDDFVKSLITNPENYMEKKYEYTTMIMEDMKLMQTGIDRLLKIIKEFYQSKNLEV